MKSKVWSLKSKVFSALLCGLCVSALIPGAMGQTNTPAGALVTFAITNSDATPYSGPLWVYSVGPGPAGTAILADGSFFITGVTKRIEVTNSLGSLRLMRGTYFASNSVMAYCLAVPLDSGTNNAASLKVGGYNLFEYVPGVTSDTVSNMAAVLLGNVTGAGPGRWWNYVPDNQTVLLPPLSGYGLYRRDTTNQVCWYFGPFSGGPVTVPTTTTNGYARSWILARSWADANNDMLGYDTNLTATVYELIWQTFGGGFAALNAVTANSYFSYDGTNWLGSGAPLTTNWGMVSYPPTARNGGPLDTTNAPAAGYGLKYDGASMYWAAP